MASSTGRRRRISSAVPSSEEAAPAAAAAKAPPRAQEPDDENHHVPRLLLPFPRVPWHRPANKPPQPASATAAAAWARLPSSPEHHHHDEDHHHHRTLLPRSAAPAYLTGNPFVLHGFRKCESMREAVDGLFYMHNAWADSVTSVGSFLHSHV